MKVGVGHSDNPDTIAAGIQAVLTAVNQAGRTDPCDLVLLFSTARHDQSALREVVSSIVGESVPIYGGGTAGIITNNYFGYAGDQIAAACIWLDGVQCEVLTEGGLKESEEETGVRLGRRLAERGTAPDSPVMLFYDAVDSTNGLRLLMATWLLAGIEKGLGFLPNLTGVGMIGDHMCNSTDQWIGDTIGKSNALALAFSGNIRMDSVIVHGCRPSTTYYTVTKAVGQVILEINGEPAIPFIDKLLGGVISPDQYPFFLIFGVNHGERWGEYDEEYYASRLCLAIDKASNGIVMFEPDMVEGTEFQLMFRSLDLDYIKPKINKIFDELDGRKPVFGVYINCAGRCAGYAGMDLEDALAIQQIVADRVPILGLYNGVEIAPIGGRSRGLDWTGVFCLFSQSKVDGDRGGGLSLQKSKPEWDSRIQIPVSDEKLIEALSRLCEQNTAKVLALDTTSVAIRLELEQKRRGFRLLAELTTSLRQNAAGYESVLIPIAKRISAALNMQRTIVLEKDEEGLFSPVVLQGYSVGEKAALAGRHFAAPVELLDPTDPVLITEVDSPDRFKELRELLGLPYFVSSPVILQNEVFAILITGRLVETPPYLIRLNRSDGETIQAISALLASVLANQRLVAAEERNRVMVDAMPTCCLFWDENGHLTDCNQAALALFELPNKEEFGKRFPSMNPEFQPDGSRSSDLRNEPLRQAFITGHVRFNWIHSTATGSPLPVETTLIRVPKGEGYTVVGYLRDLRDQEAAVQKQNEAKEMMERYAKAKNEFLASISHEIRTPMNAIAAMVRVATESRDINEVQQNLVRQGIRSMSLLTSAIETILDFSKLDSGQLALETVEFSLREMLENLHGIVSEDAREKSLTLSLVVDADVPEFVLGDSERLQQALLNIVVNAIKFTEAGGVDIRVFRRASVRNDVTSLTFEVRDTGIGIDENHRANLFTPLMAGDTAYTRKHGGMGMGLPISNGLIALMGGNITCESRVGKGSVFRITVSFALPEERVVETPKNRTISNTEALRGMRILVAEDNRVNQMIIRELLSAVGIETSMAENGIEALEKLQSDVFDLVLMDIQMPEMDGLTATTQIRSDLRYNDLPILAMTANVGTEFVMESIRAGMNDHLTKPIDVDKLYAALIKWGRR